VDRVVTIRDGSTSSETVRRVQDVEAALLALDAQAQVAHVYEEFVMVDGAGRLQIPPDLRSEMSIGDRVTLERADGGILIRPVAGAGPALVAGGQDPAETEDAGQLPSRHGRWAGLLRRNKRR